MFGAKNGNKQIDAGLATFTKAQAQIIEGIKANEAAITANEAEVAKKKAELEKFEGEKTAQNTELKAKNAKGQRFVDRITAFFGDDDDAASTEVNDVVEKAAE